MLEGEEKYERSLVSFVDILGFKNMVERESPREILETLRAKDRFKVFRGGAVEPEDMTLTFNFSDLIVNVTPMPERFSAVRFINRLFYEFCLLGFVQSRLTMQGVFVRGGIALGNVYAKGRTLFGPALVAAYELESKRAHWPIIAVDDDIIRLILRTARPFVEERKVTDGGEEFLALAYLAQFCTFIEQTDESVFFLDYLNCLAFEDATTGDIPYYLEDHKKSVADALEKHKHYKYEFVARYHNAKCKAQYPSLMLDGFPNTTFAPYFSRMFKPGELTLLDSL